MPNMEVTNVDLGSVVYRAPEFRDELITFAGAATLKEGTILARDTATDKMVIFVKGGTTNGNGVPNAVLTYEVEAAGAGDVAARPALGGVFVKERLVIHADGDDSEVDAAVLDGLRQVGIRAVNVAELGKQDNQ